MNNVLGEVAYNTYRDCNKEKDMPTWKELDQVPQLIWSIIGASVGLKVLEIQEEMADMNKYIVKAEGKDND